MSRPDYPNCVMTPGVIRGVKERQDAYDADPEAYEEAERQEEERQQQENLERSKMNLNIPIDKQGIDDIPDNDSCFKCGGELEVVEDHDGVDDISWLRCVECGQKNI